jgi:spore coat polysaccharide biosynthesis protein SpsF
MKIVAITQARISSTRFPAKILYKNEFEQTMLEVHLGRIKKSKLIDELIVATTTEEGVGNIIKVADKLTVKYYQGSLHNVLDRFYQSIQSLGYEPDIIVRLTSDCPLVDPELIDEVISEFKSQEIDYMTNAIEPTYPHGMDVEVFTYKALKKAWEETVDDYDREHVAPYIVSNSNLENRNLFKAKLYQGEKDYSHLRMTLDYEEDYTLINKLMSRVGVNSPWIDYANEMENDKSLIKINWAFNRSNKENK